MTNEQVQELVDTHEGGSKMIAKNERPVSRTRQRAKNWTLYQQMRDVVTRALEISGLDAEYDAICAQVADTFGDAA